MMLKEKVKSLDVPVIFSRESSDSHNRKTNVYLSTTVHIKIWNEGPYKESTLSMMVGTSGMPIEEKVNGQKVTYFAPMLRVIWNHNDDNSEELEDFRMREFDGLDVSVDEDEKIVTDKEAISLIRSGKVKFLNEDLSKRTFYV